MTGKNILTTIVEDDGILREAMVLALEDDSDIVLHSAHSTAENFLQCFEHALPDVVIMDIHLPGMNGIEAMRQVKARFPTIQFLMCTVQDDDDNLFEALCAGATGYLLKDASFEQVVASVKEVHGGGSPMSPGIARRVLNVFSRTRPVMPASNNLTPRELQVVEKLATGLRYKEIAEQLDMRLDTVRAHVRNLYEKLQVSSRIEAVNKIFPR